MERPDFVRVAYPEPHPERARQILREHPEIRDLFGTEPRTALWAVLLVSSQLLCATVMAHTPWWLFLLTSYLLGATLNHALWVIIHECTHRLVFRRGVANRGLAIFANLPHGVPSAMAFFKYHMLHHVRQGELEFDADLPAPEEARLVGSSPWRKAGWMLMFSFINGAVRPGHLKQVKLVDGWLVVNVAVQAMFLAWFYSVTSGWAVAYLFLSTFWGLGLHPMGGRWIAEHYLVHEHQETNSYYGSLNRLAFNVGYHTEHHDFMRVPWNRLPQVTYLAPEFYAERFAYRSWGAALRRFILNREASPFDRVTRDR